MSLPKIRLERCERTGLESWQLDEEQARHLTKALRLYEGATVEGLLDESGPDAAGKRFLLRLEKEGEGYLVRAVDSEAAIPDELSLTLLIGLLKADQFEAVLRASAELGLASILPVVCERSVPRIGAAEIGKKMVRWGRIIDEGTKVSGAIVPPRLSSPVDFTRLEWDRLPQKRYAAMLSQKAVPISACFPPSLPDLSAADERTSVVLAVGPEGDWSDTESRLLLKNGFTAVGLGGRILRAATAALLGCGWIRLAHGS